MSNMQQLLNSMPQSGQIEWIGIRAARRSPLESVEEAQISIPDGLVGDHYKGRSKKRQVTFIMAEHLANVASLLGIEKAEPGLARRNIVVSGINLLAFNDRRFQIGDEVVMEMTGICHPCSRMEENFGAGGYNAMRGHSGINARVIQGGTIRLGDAVRLVPANTIAESEQLA